jgi:hypothetical protein
MVKCAERNITQIIDFLKYSHFLFLIILKLEYKYVILTIVCHQEIIVYRENLIYGFYTYGIHFLIAF